MDFVQISGLQGTYGGAIAPQSVQVVRQLLVKPSSFMSVTRPSFASCVDPRVCESGERLVAPHFAGGSAALLLAAQYALGGSYSEHSEGLRRIGVSAYTHGPTCGALGLGAPFAKRLFAQLPEEVGELISEWGVRPPSNEETAELRTWGQFTLNGEYLSPLRELEPLELFDGGLNPALVVVSSRPGRVFSAQKRFMEITDGQMAFAVEPWAARQFAARLIDPMQLSREAADIARRRFVLATMLYTAGVIHQLAAPGVASVTV